MENRKAGIGTMLKISSKTSATISLVLSFLFFFVIIAGIIILPAFVKASMEFPTEKMINSTNFDKHIILSLGYTALAIIFVANVMLMKLLFRVRVELVFTPESISLIRVISWCIVLLGLVFLALGYYFLVSSFAAFACIFLGLCLRVVKNVIEKATEIKNENDFTI